MGAQWGDTRERGDVQPHSLGGTPHPHLNRAATPPQAPLPKSGHPPVASTGRQIGGGLPSPPRLWGPLGGVSHLDPLELGFTTPPMFMGSLPPGPPPCLWAPSPLDPPHVYGAPPSWTPPTFMGSLPPGPPPMYGVPPPWTPPCLWGPYGLPNESPPPQNQGHPSKHLQPSISPNPYGSLSPVVSGVGGILGSLWGGRRGALGGSGGALWGCRPPLPSFFRWSRSQAGGVHRGPLQGAAHRRQRIRILGALRGQRGWKMGGRDPKWRPNPIYGAQTPQMEAESHLWGPNPPTSHLDGGGDPKWRPNPINGIFGS